MAKATSPWDLPRYYLPAVPATLTLNPLPSLHSHRRRLTAREKKWRNGSSTGECNDHQDVLHRSPRCTLRIPMMYVAASLGVLHTSARCTPTSTTIDYVCQPSRSSGTCLEVLPRAFATAHRLSYGNVYIPQRPVKQPRFSSPPTWSLQCRGRARFLSLHLVT